MNQMVRSNNSLPPRALLTSTVRPEVGAEIPYAALYGFPVHKVHRVHSLPVKITVPKGEKETPWFSDRGHHVGTKLHSKLSSLSFRETNTSVLVFPQAGGKEIRYWGEGYSFERQKDEGKLNRKELETRFI